MSNHCKPLLQPMKTKYLTLLASGIVLSTTAAFAEMKLPVNLDFQDDVLFPVGPLKGEDFAIYISPRDAAPGIEVAQDPDAPKNKVLVVRSNGTSVENRLKMLLPPLDKPFEYQFRCKVVGEIVPGGRSLLNLYVKDQWGKSVAAVIPFWAGNKIYGVVDGKFKDVQEDLVNWRTIKVVVNTDGKAPYTYSYSLFVDDKEVLSQVPMVGKFDVPLSVAEIALDFDSPGDVTKVKYLIDDIKIGSPTIDSPSAK